MDLARFVVDAVVLEGRSCREVARAHGVSKSWVAKLVSRHRAGGYEALTPRSKAASKVANKSPAELEDRVVRLRKELTDAGFDAGAQTIHYLLSQSDPAPPSVSTIWRILKRRGFVTPQPHKRPKSSFISFEASLPNEMWQSDVTVFALKDGTKVEICNFLDDFSRVCVASKVHVNTTAPDVVATLYEAGSVWGLPASLLTDNGCIYTAAYRHGYSALESELFHLGIDYKHSAFDSRDKARPIKREGTFTRELRVRHDRVDAHGVVTIRYKSKLHHIGMGRALKGTSIILLVAGRNIRIIATDGELLRDFELDPNRNYQAQRLG
ncbi:MAG: DDE-type integrase/transposase/recombinase [Actinomycetota bacterium]|nr:DDE-type integrase/transposase/recombinase [Actinomycetota bacterium]